MEHEVVGKVRARVAAIRHGNPARSLKIIAVAGPHGKTTTALLLSEILQETGRSVMAFTNHGCFHNSQQISERCDTSADAVQRSLAVARKKDVDYVIMEINDAFLATHVLPTLLIEMSVITGESTAAQEVLSQPVNYTVVPSGFDVAGLSVAPHQAISFGNDISSEAQIVSTNLRRKGTEIEMVIDHQTKLEVATYLVGAANVQNVAAAVSAAYVLATDTSAFQEGVARLERVAGNYDFLTLSADAPYEVAVDAATSPESIELVLSSAAKLKKRRLLVVLDASVLNDVFPQAKVYADKLVVVGETLEIPGVETASSIQDALDLVKRGAKKDDVILLIGKQFAALEPQGSTKAQDMMEATQERNG